MHRRRWLELAMATAASLLAPGRALAAAVCERLVARIGQNHGHLFSVSAADVRAGVDKRYDLTGSAGHPHTVVLTADDFARLGGGAIVRMATSRDGGHAHRVYVRCAPAVDPPDAVNVCAIEVGGKDDHEFVISADDMAKKVARTYDIQGISPHTHAITVTAADFARLLQGEAVVLSSTAAEGHTHRAYIRYPIHK